MKVQDMKLLVAVSICAGMVFGQKPGKIVTFNKADTEHCKVIIAGGKPLLQSTFEGTTVAIAMPVNRGNGDFSIYARISRTADGTIRVNPKEFYGLFSDKDHSRFQFYDKAADYAAVNQPGADPSLSAGNLKYDSSIVRRDSTQTRNLASGTSQASAGPAPAQKQDLSGMYLQKGDIKPGTGIAGWITLRQAKGHKLEVQPKDMLDEIDIPVNGVLFRF